MVNKNGTTDSFWKTVKIKELPVKEEVDRRSVLLIEDDQIQNKCLWIFFIKP